MWRLIRGRELGFFVRRGKLSDREGTASSESVRLGESRKFFANNDTPTAQESHGVFGRWKKKGAYAELEF